MNTRLCFKNGLAGFFAAIAVGLLMAGSAAAAPLNYSTNFSAGVGVEWIISTSFNNHDAGILGQLADGSATLSIASPGAGSGTLSFDLLGFRTVDGFNCCTDTFNLSLNSVNIFTGVFDMGGGGGEGFSPATASVSFINQGDRLISLAVSLQAGVNTLVFDYGAMQGFGDEAWGLDNVSLSANVTTAVPEPETYAMLLAGLGLLGFVARRRKQQAT